MDSKSRMLGAVFPSYPMSNEERTRIAKELLSDGLHKRIIARYASQTPPYKLFQKNEKIRGIRQGVQAYHKRAIPRIIQHLNDPNFKNYDFCWEIYKCAATSYVGTELPTLDKLLAEVPYEGQDIDSSELLRTICTNAFEFDVKPEDIKNLYEVWWITRVEHIDEFLGLCSKPDELQIQGKAIRAISAKIDNLDTKLKDLAQQLGTATAVSAQQQSNILEHSKQLAAHESTIATITNQTSKTPSLVAAEIAKAIQPLDEELRKLRTQSSSLSAKLGDFINSQSLKNERAAKETKETIQKTQKEYSEAANELLEQKLAEIMEDLDKKLMALSELRTTNTGPTLAAASSQPNYKSPLLAACPARTSSFKITKESEFLNAWAARVSQSQGSSFGFEQIVAFHAIFLANNVIVCDLPLVLSWIDCLGWRPYTKNLVASPIWSAEEDWAQGAQHLFGDTSAHLPKILVIHNYDLGLVDCYLAPSLVLWAVNECYKQPWSKLFLIPSLQSPPPSYQVLNHSAYAIIHKEQSPSCRQLADGISVPTTLRQSFNIGVDLKIATQWLQLDGGHDDDLTAIQKSLNIELCDWLNSNFRRTVSQATKYFQEPSAVGLGMTSHVLPWVRSRYSESEASALDAYLRQLPDVVL